MPDLFFNPEWKDSDNSPVPLSRRFGKCRRWHPDLDFLYEVEIQQGRRSWASCLRFSSEELEVIRLAHQNQ